MEYLVLYNSLVSQLLMFTHGILSPADDGTDSASDTDTMDENGRDESFSRLMRSFRDETNSLAEMYSGFDGICTTIQDIEEKIWQRIEVSNKHKNNKNKHNSDSKKMLHKSDIDISKKSGKEAYKTEIVDDRKCDSKTKEPKLMHRERSATKHSFVTGHDFVDETRHSSESEIKTKKSVFTTAECEGETKTRGTKREITDSIIMHDMDTRKRVKSGAIGMRGKGTDKALPIKSTDTTESESINKTELLEGRMKGTETENGVLKKELRDLYDKIQHKDTIIKDLKSEIEAISSMMKGLNRRIEELRGKIQIKDTEIQDFKKKIDGLNNKIQIKETEINDSKRETNDLHRRVEELSSTIHVKDTQMNGLKEEIECVHGTTHVKDTEIEKLKGEICGLKSEIRGKDIELNDLKEETECLNNTIQVKETETKDLQEQNGSLSTAVQDKDVQIMDLNREKDEMTSKYHELQAYIASKTKEPDNETCPVQIYCPGETNLSITAIDLLSESLRSSFGDVKIDLLKCHSASDLNQDLPTVCVCVTVLRLGSDVMNALQNIKISSNVVLVIMHHKAPHSKPAAASRRVILDEKYKSLGGMFDLLFEKDKLHVCEMNTTNIAEIVDCLKQIIVRFLK